jgi:hypothetical protein
MRLKVEMLEEEQCDMMQNESLGVAAGKEQHRGG